MYVADSGILHALLGLSTREAILSHPEVGASWEGFVVQQIIQLLAASAEQCFHWSTHAGAQLDLLVVAGNRRYGFEVKRAEAPRTTPSMRSALETLGLDRLDVVHAGGRSYAMAPGIRALPAASLAKVLRPLGGVTRLSSPPLAIGCLRLPDLIGSTAPVRPCGPYETSAASALSRVRAVPPSIIRRQEETEPIPDAGAETDRPGDGFPPSNGHVPARIPCQVSWTLVPTWHVTPAQSSGRFYRHSFHHPFGNARMPQ